jgi:hypothetical protein
VKTERLSQKHVLLALGLAQQFTAMIGVCNIDQGHRPLADTATAELIATIRSLRAMINGSFVKSLARISSFGLSSTQS